MNDQDNDYMRVPVPDHATVSGYKIGIVILGIGMTLPVFVIGADTATAVGIWPAFWIFAASCALLSVLLGITSIIGSRTRLSTYVILEFAFGVFGARLINLLLAGVLLVWFSATADFLGGGVRDALLSMYDIQLPRAFYTVACSLFMILTAIFGFRLVERFSALTVPLLALFMIYVVYVAIGLSGDSAGAVAQAPDRAAIGAAISTVMGTFVITAVLAPDLTRYAASDREALKSVAGFLIGYPLILVAAAVPAVALGEADIMKIMIGLGVSGIALYIIVMSTWTTNTVNLYSSILTLSTVFTSAPGWKIGVVAGVLATVAAAAGLADYFIVFVMVLGAGMTPVAGIYIADFFFVRKQRYDIELLRQAAPFNLVAFVAWILASAIGYATSEGHLQLTGVSALDSLVSAFILYLLLTKIRPAQVRATT